MVFHEIPPSFFLNELGLLGRRFIVVVVAGGDDSVALHSVVGQTSDRSTNPNNPLTCQQPWAPASEHTSSVSRRYLMTSFTSSSRETMTSKVWREIDGNLQDFLRKVGWGERHMLTNNMGKKKWGVLRETPTLEVESENMCMVKNQILLIDWSCHHNQN